MMYRHNDFMETVVHQCADADKYTTEHRRKIAMVRRHDVSTFIDVVTGCKLNGQKTYKTIHIKYCPFCGCNLAADEETGKTLNLKLL